MPINNTMKVWGSKVRKLSGFTAIAAATAALASVAIGPAAFASPSAVNDSTGCSTGVLPSALEGVPASFHSGLALGTWVWHTPSGYSIRDTHPQNRQDVAFSGVVQSATPIVATGVRLEKDDLFAVTSSVVNHHTLYTLNFTFENGGYTDGIDFTSSCASSITFKFRADGALIAPARVLMGASAVPAATNAFTAGRAL